MGEDLQQYIIKGMEEMRKVVIDNNAAIHGLEGEFRSFKEGITDRLNRHETTAGQQKRNGLSLTSIAIAVAALAVSIFEKIFKDGG